MRSSYSRRRPAIRYPPIYAGIILWITGAALIAPAAEHQRSVKSRAQAPALVHKSVNLEF